MIDPNLGTGVLLTILAGIFNIADVSEAVPLASNLKELGIAGMLAIAVIYLWRAQRASHTKVEEDLESKQDEVQQVQDKLNKTREKLSLLKGLALASPDGKVNAQKIIEVINE